MLWHELPKKELTPGQKHQVSAEGNALIERYRKRYVFAVEITSLSKWMVAFSVVGMIIPGYALVFAVVLFVSFLSLVSSLIYDVYVFKQLMTVRLKHVPEQYQTKFDKAFSKQHVS